MLSISLAAYTTTAGSMSLSEYMSLNGPEPTAHIAYGKAPSQYAELFEPAGDGPFPVVVLLHGGCWNTEFEGIRQFRKMSGALAAQGIAVWNVEYRRADEEGGGYPGMYLDMIAALDALKANAGKYRINLSRIVAVGHSAGGFLAQWIAGRARIPASSPFYRADLLPVRQVIGLGSINNLREGTGPCGVSASKLTGAASASRPDVFSDTNPADLIPNGSTTVLINGDLDGQVPPEVAARFAAKARTAGDRVTTIVLKNANHFDEVAATSPSWQTILGAIKGALAATPP
jgi:acetyl esterase/lipase